VSGVPAGVAFSALGASYYHTCGLRAADGHVLCWGDPDYGGAFTAGVAMLEIDARDGMTCALRASDQAITCWGHNFVFNP
jgi:hypothetical protein